MEPMGGGPRPLGAPGRCEVWWAGVNSATDSLTALLPAPELTRLARLRRRVDRHRGLVAWALARVVLADLTGVSPPDVAIDRTCPQCTEPHGKPRLVDGSSGLEFSLTHSGQWTAVAVVHGAPVGVDVEQDTAARLDALLPRIVLTPDEEASLAPAGDPHGFLRYWVRKEAVVKAVGTGLRTPFNSFAVSAPDALASLVSWPDDPGLPHSTSLVDLADRSGHLGAVAVLTPGVAVVERDGAALLRIGR